MVESSGSSFRESQASPESSGEGCTTGCCLKCLRRICEQTDPWMKYFKRFLLFFIMSQVVLFVVIILFCLRMFTDYFGQDNVHWFTYSASGVYILRFIFMWLFTPEGPPFLADEDEKPRYLLEDDPELQRESFLFAEGILEA